MKKLTKVWILTLIMMCLTLPVMAQNGRRLMQFLEKQKQKKSVSSSGNQQGTTAVTISSGGLNRVYHIHLPQGYNNATRIPVVFVFHGGSGTGVGIARVSHMNTEADQRGFIAIYPDGIDRHWSIGRQDFAEKSNANDVGFVQDIVKKLQGEMNIDSSRIYTCGISEGGLFSQKLACQLPNIFSAAASISANTLAHTNAAPSQPFPIMYMLGTSDPLMPFKGGEIKIGKFGKSRGAVLSGDDSVAGWVQYDRCPPKPFVTGYGQPGAKLSIESRSYGPGANNSEVVYCIVNDGGHCWPGGEQYMPAAIVGHTSPIDANEIIWQFFCKHALSN